MKTNKKELRKLNKVAKTAVAKIEKLIDIVEEYSMTNEIQSDTQCKLYDSMMSEYEIIKDIEVLSSFRTLSLEYWSELRTAISHLIRENNETIYIISTGKDDCSISENLYYELKDESKDKIKAYKALKSLTINLKENL